MVPTFNHLGEGGVAEDAEIMSAAHSAGEDGSELALGFDDVLQNDRDDKVKVRGRRENNSFMC